MDADSLLQPSGAAERSGSPSKTSPSANIPWLQRGLSQVLVTAFVAFCGPGFFNALQGLGGAGNANPSANDAANVALYLCLTASGALGGAFFNVLGARVLMCAGGLTYALYALCAYLNGHSQGFGRLFVASGGVLGLGAGWLWTAQGALMMAYAPMGRKGYYIGLFWLVFNSGGCIGGLLQLGLNFRTEVRAASPASYFVFIAVMVLGSVAAAALLLPPDRVIKEDNAVVVLHRARPPSQEVRDVLAAAGDRRMLLLAAFFFGSNFYYTYVFNGVNGVLFTVRTRGLNSALYWVSQMVGAMALGRLLDRPGWSVGRRGKAGFWVVAVLCNAIYLMGAYLQFGFLGGYERHRPLSRGLIDFTDVDWPFPMLVLFSYGVGDSIVQAYSYWIMGAIAGDDAQLCARYTGFYKGVQSFGAAVAWLVDMEAFDVSYGAQFAACWAVFVVGLPTAYVIVMELRKTEKESICVT